MNFSLHTRLLPNNLLLIKSKRFIPKKFIAGTNRLVLKERVSSINSVTSILLGSSVILCSGCYINYKLTTQILLGIENKKIGLFAASIFCILSTTILYIFAFVVSVKYISR